MLVDKLAILVYNEFMEVKTLKTEFAEQVTFRLDPEVKKELRMKVLREGTTIQEVYEKLTVQFLKS